MLKNHHLAKAIGDAGLAEFHRQIKYKTAWRSGEVIKADRFYPSSKTCSNCGYIMSISPLDVRKWVCPKCSVTHDRDLNAAINLRNLAVSSTVTACCPSSSGSIHKNRTKLPVGQESNATKVPKLGR